MALVVDNATAPRAYDDLERVIFFFVRLSYSLPGY